MRDVYKELSYFINFAYCLQPRGPFMATVLWILWLEAIERKEVDFDRYVV